MSNSDVVKWNLFSNDLTTQVGGDVPAISSSLLLVYNEPGSGEISLPLGIDLVDDISSGMLALCNYRGATRGGFFIDNIREVDANQSEGSGRVLSINGRGLLSVLDTFHVLGDGTTNTTRTFSNMTKAAIVAQLIDEAQAHDALANVSYDFTDTQDSDSNSWTDNESYSFPVGQKILEVVRTFCKVGNFDVSMSLSGGDLVLSAYLNPIGDNLTDEIFFRIGYNCEEVTKEVRAGKELVNEYLYKFLKGYGLVRDQASIDTHGLNADFLNLEQAQTEASARTFAAAKLSISKDPKESKGVKLYDGIAPNIFLDYSMGDSVSIDRFGTITEDKILGMQLDFGGEGYAVISIDFNYIFLEQELRVQQSLDYLLSAWNTAHDAGLTEVSFWDAVGNNFGSYFDLISYNGFLYISGNGRMNGVSGRGVAQYNPVTGVFAAVGNDPFTFVVVAIHQLNGDLFVANDNGSTDVPSTDVYKLIGSTWTKISGTSVFATVDDNVNRLIDDDLHYLYVAYSNVVSVNGVTIHRNVAIYDNLAANWVSIGSSSDGQTDSCNDLVFYNGDLYGAFSGDSLTDEGLQMNPDGANEWSTVAISNISGKTCQALAVVGSSLVIACEEEILLWDGVSGSAEVIGTLSGGDARAHRIIVNLSDIYIGGNFDSVDGIGVNHIAKYSGGLWFKLGTSEAGVTDTVRGMLFYGDDLYVVGDFDIAGGKAVDGFAVYITEFQNMVESIDRQNQNFDLAGAIHNAAAATLSDEDEFGFWENVVQGIRKITWANIKSTLQTFFNGVFARLDATNMPFTNVIVVTNNNNNGDGGIRTETLGDQYTADFEQSTVNSNVSSPTLFLFRRTSGTGNITSAMISGFEVDTGAGSITGDLINLIDRFIVNHNGKVNIPAGQTYDIDGSPHTHSGSSGHVIEDEGAPLAARSKLNFVGAGVTATDDAGNDETDITIPGAVWGAVTGTLSDQTDLQTELDARIRIFIDTTAPTSTDDTDAGYVIGDWWIDTVGGGQYQALSVVSGDAIWKRFTNDLGTEYLAAATAAIVGSDLLGFLDTSATAFKTITVIDFADFLQLIFDSVYQAAFIAGNGIAFTGSTLNVNVDGSTIEISSDVLRVKDGGITLAKMANLAANSIIGNNTGGAATPIALSASQVRTLLSLVIGTNVQAWDADLDYLSGVTLAANIKSILEAADYAAVRTLLGLVIGTNVQAFDADLSYLAGVTPTANVKAIWEAADYAAIRTLLGLVIGTNVQAYDAELAALAGLTSAADKLPYFTGSGTAALADLTSFIRTVLDDTSAAAAAATLAVIPTDGWIQITATWTRTGNHTFTAAGDVTAIYRKGTYIRYKDGGAFEYGVIGSSSHSAGTTTINLIINTDYAMAAVTITDTWISYIINPEGFPDSFNYTPTYSGSGSMTFTSVSTTTAFWKVVGRMFTAVVNATGTTGGTASVSLQASHPITALEGQNGAAVTRDATSGAVILAIGLSDTTNMIVRKGDGTNYGLGAGRILSMTISGRF